MSRPRKAKTDVSVTRRFWVVMRALQMDRLEIAGIPLGAPPGGPQRFLPVFDTREQALEFVKINEFLEGEIAEITTSTSR